MADVPAASRAKVFATEVIDLTLSDGENASQQQRLHQIPPRSETPSTGGNDATFPDHGLLLERDFGLSNHWASNRANLLSLGLVKEVPPQIRHRNVSKPSSINKDVDLPSNKPPIQVYQTSSRKRRRIELDMSRHYRGRNQGDTPQNVTLSPLIDSIEASRGSTSLPNSQSNLAQAHAVKAPQQRPGGDEKSKEAMNESLKFALRQQVFPHINQRLGNYRLSIDNATRRRLSKQAAWEICGEDFMENLMRNDGRLSAMFETKVAAMARSLIDQFAINFINDSKNGRDYNEVYKQAPLHKVQQKLDPPRLDESGTAALVDSAESARAKRKARLSTAMKGRWERGEMNSVTARRAARNSLRRARDNHTSAASSPSKLSRLRKRSVPPRPHKPQRILDDDDTELPAYQNGSKVHRELSIQQSTPHMSRSTHALKQKQPTSELEGNAHSIRRSARRPAIREVSAAIIVTDSQPNTQRARGKRSSRIPGTQNFQELVHCANSHDVRHQIENLRLAGLDEQISRPYLNWQHRKDIETGIAMIQSNQKLHGKVSRAELSALHGAILHVDFCPEEIDCIISVIGSVTGSTSFSDGTNSKTRIENLIVGREKIIPKLLTALSAARQSPRSKPFQSRTNSAIAAFLQDAAAGLVPTRPEIKRVELSSLPSANPVIPPDSIQSILRQREQWGRRHNPKFCRSFKAQLLNHIEDDMIREAEWTDCAGDIATISWIDDTRFLCGATAHSDEHNMQYNKPGNLLVGSIVGKTLKSVSGHQIVRPIVTEGENSLASMRGTQDPWMYCSVTSTAYSHNNKKCFTGSYDQTVKVWDIADDGSSMSLCGTWIHSGNVNFVVASPIHGLVATAADVREDAVRVYHFDHNDISASPYDVYEASVQRRNSNDTWAYFPATMQWGISPPVSHLLLVGYSPRSFNCHDAEIPDDKLNTGELCLWDSRNGNRVAITSARTQNVFEVAWHPTQPIFAAATSPTGAFEDWVKTQIRIFEQKACGSFSHVKTLDCRALDINEITIMPNSIVHCYVTASCTDGNTYVWDSALSDKPMHILSHDESIDEPIHGLTREEADVGVKFATWGKNSDRFYTGSSDGVLKAWNIRAAPGKELVQDVIRLSGGISAGKFSPDFSKLVIGDSTGKVHFLAIGKDEPNEKRIPGIRRPIKPHPPLPAPLIDDDDVEMPPEPSAQEQAQQFLDRQQMIVHSDEYIGAVQGPKYSSTGLFYDIEKYKDENGQDDIGWSNLELKEKQAQRYEIDKLRLPRLSKIQSSSRLYHQRNAILDLNVAILPHNTLTELRKQQVDFDFQDDNEFAFELSLRSDTDETERNILRQDELLDDVEIHELCILETQICQELKIQKSLKGLLEFSK